MKVCRTRAIPVPIADPSGWHASQIRTLEFVLFAGSIFAIFFIGSISAIVIVIATPFDVNTFVVCAFKFVGTVTSGIVVTIVFICPIRTIQIMIAAPTGGNAAECMEGDVDTLFAHELTFGAHHTGFKII